MTHSGLSSHKKDPEAAVWTTLAGAFAPASFRGLADIQIELLDPYSYYVSANKDLVEAYLDLPEDTL